MSKFKVVKKLPLDFLGDSWKDAYINFEAFSIKEVKDEFPQLANIDQNDVASLPRSFDKIINLISKKFVDGKAPNDKAELVDLTKEDIPELPAELIERSLSFLSQGIVKP